MKLFKCRNCQQTSAPAVGTPDAGHGLVRDA